MFFLFAGFLFACGVVYKTRLGLRLASSVWHSSPFLRFVNLWVLRVVAGWFLWLGVRSCFSILMLGLGVVQLTLVFALTVGFFFWMDRKK